MHCYALHYTVNGIRSKDVCTACNSIHSYNIHYIHVAAQLPDS